MGLLHGRSSPIDYSLATQIPQELLLLFRLIFAIVFFTQFIQAD
jgi:hypothetical protein